MNICFDYGVIAPTFEVIHKGLKVVIFKEKLNEPLNELLNERQKLLFELLKNNKNITRNELVIECKVSLNTIKRDLVLLQKLNLIRREGSDKIGYWKILK